MFMISLLDVEVAALFILFFNYYYVYIVGLYMTFIYGTAEDMTGNRMRERGSDMQQSAPGQDFLL